MSLFGRSDIRRTLLGMALTLSLMTPASADTETRSANNTEIPSYALDTAACAALRAKGPFAISIDPYAISGVAPEPGLTIEAVIMPDTPVFGFYERNQKTFFFLKPAFEPKMNCIIDDDRETGQSLHFKQIPPGTYIVMIETSVAVEYTSYSSGSVDEPGDGSAEHPGYREVEIPQRNRYYRERVYGLHLVVSKSGGVTMTPAHYLTGSPRLRSAESVLPAVAETAGTSVLPAAGRRIDIPDGTPVVLHFFASPRYRKYDPTDDYDNAAILQVDKDVVVGGQVVVAKGSLGLAHIDGIKTFSVMGIPEGSQISCHMVSVFSAASTQLELDPTPFSMQMVGVKGMFAKIPTDLPEEQQRMANAQYTAKLKHATVTLP